ncbi:glycosyltransferase family 2 protein [Helicobacter sp. MIT 99-5507]|uniref:glycosyltransferase family 2 protein n=1 Tax=Helicobacter sp. MIT 99-5507 TaxID=152489 RepID=UPI000E1EC382|nr:glycosyltransferase family 2 protein [Helicobacter sp. MIT 99-5507]RDU58235.1 glycosyl transferase [Helicobacter sp. MIT 99-5507]
MDFINYKISVITATFNSQATIKQTLDSVSSQNYLNIEHIIVDGKSNDNTLKIIESYKPIYEAKNIKLIISSKKDLGIYDAFNRGIELSSGDLIGFLNSDDFFSNNNILSIINWAFNKPGNKKVETISANLEYIDSRYQIIRKLQGRNISKKDFKKGFHPAHPTFYARKEIFNKYGKFDLSYKIAGDYELMLRLLVKHNINNLYINDNFVKMKIGGVSNQNLKNIYEANVECFRAWKENHLAISPLFIFIKPLKKIKEINFIKYIKYMISKTEGGGS